MGKSFLSKIEGFVLKKTKPKFMNSQKELDKFLDKKLDKEDSNIKTIFKISEINGIKCFTFGKKNRNIKILYVHGGAYVNELNNQHLLYCYLLSRKLDAYVIAPLYPLTPKNTYEKSYDVLLDTYSTLDGNIFIMGDSAGGGLALGFCQYLKSINLAQPNGIIVFSPWVDISMSNEYDSDNDIILGEIGLKGIGEAWAGNEGTKYYKVSPLYGNNEGLANVLVFSGTNEIFYKDIEKYVENLKKDNVNFKFIVGEGLFHIYPLFPIPEAKSAFKEIKEFIYKNIPSIDLK